MHQGLGPDISDRLTELNDFTLFCLFHNKSLIQEENFIRNFHLTPNFLKTWKKVSKTDTVSKKLGGWKTEDNNLDKKISFIGVKLYDSEKPYWVNTNR